MVVFAAQGDARRSMGLLWRDAGGSVGGHTGPGPKPGLSVDLVVAAGIEVADTDGMAGLSMRAVGERLGRTAMALYTYVPSKSELIDLMYDQALAELPTDYDLAAGWRAALTAWANDCCGFYLRHPWMLHVSQARPILGPHEYAFLETLARILGATGLRSSALRRIVGVLTHFVRGSAQTIAEARIAPDATGVSDEDWWSARSALLLELVPDLARRFPAAAGLDADGVFDPDDSRPYLEQEAAEIFSQGLDVVLDGIEATVTGAAG